MKILLTGSNGQLGKAIIESKPKKFDLISTNRSSFDLENIGECTAIIKDLKPQWVINTAAYTNVDKAESEEKLVYKVNYQAPEGISHVIDSYGGKLMQISTDYVFNGENNHEYKTSYKKSPINIYGKSKDLAEQSISKILRKDNQLIILRTSWLISPFGKNFLLTILNLLNTKDKIEVVDDQFGSPTSTFSLSEIIWKLIEKNNESSLINRKLPNVFHWSEEGTISWYELALAIKKISQELNLIKNPADILPISSKEYRFKAERPLYSVLDCKDTEKLLKIKRPNWESSVKKILKYISENNSELI